MNWPSVRSRWLDIGQDLFFACLWTKTEPRYINSQKKRTRAISSHLERASLVNKGFTICLLGKFFLRDTAGSPERVRYLHLARSGSQSQRRIWFTLRAHGANHIMYQSNRNFNIPPGYLTPFPAPAGGNLITLIFPGAGYLITTHRGWGI